MDKNSTGITGVHRDMTLAATSNAVFDAGVCLIAFAAHIRATGSGWHYISFPMPLGLEREGDLRAVEFDGPAPPWDRIPWKQLTPAMS